MDGLPYHAAEWVHLTAIPTLTVSIDCLARQPLGVPTQPVQVNQISAYKFINITLLLLFFIELLFFYWKIPCLNYRDVLTIGGNVYSLGVSQHISTCCIYHLDYAADQVVECFRLQVNDELYWSLHPCEWYDHCFLAAEHALAPALASIPNWNSRQTFVTASTSLKDWVKLTNVFQVTKQIKQSYKSIKLIKYYYFN